MIEDVSKSMFKKFTASFSARIAGDAPGAEASDSVSVTEVAGTVVKGDQLAGDGHRCAATAIGDYSGRRTAVSVPLV